MSNEIAPIKPPFRVGTQKTGLTARREAAALATNAPVEVSPAQMKHRIGIVFDDSGSMCDQMTTTHEAIEEFLRSCTKDQTAVAIYPLNQAPILLTSALPAIALMVKKIYATGGTHIKRATEKMFRDNKLTRAIIFSDGHNGDGDIPESILNAGICIDTVYIGPDDEYAIKWLQNIAKRTDGIFLHFKPGTANFKTAFKYLSPGLRYMLADRSFVDKLEGK